jgi:MFS family permease
MTGNRSAYRDMFATPAAPRLYLLGLLGRVPMGMIALLVVLTIEQERGGFAVAGQVAGALAIGLGVLSPVRGRLVDRRGVRSVMVSSGITHALSLAALWPLSVLDVPTPVLLLNGLVIGMTMPPTGIVMRAAWSRMFPDDRRRRAAFSAESLSVQSTLLVGPVLVSVATLTIGVGWGLVSCAVLALPSALALGTSRTLQALMRPDENAADRHWAGALRSPVVWLSLPAGFGLFAAITAMEITVAAQAVQASAAWVAGWLIAAFAVGGLAGGVAWGWRPWPGKLVVQLMVLQLLIGGALVVLAPGLPLPVVAAVLFLAGVLFPPAMTAQFSLLDEAVPRAVLTESFSWLNAARQAGSAAAGAVAGLTIDSAGPAAGWLVGAVAAVVATVPLVFLARVAPPGRGPVADEAVQLEPGEESRR